MMKLNPEFEIDHGKLSTIAVTLLTPMLGAIILNPQLIPLDGVTIMGVPLLTIIITAYNYLNPR